MARTLTSAMTAAVAAKLVRPAILYEGEFPNGTVRLWSGFGTITWNGQTWVGAGQMLGVSAIGEVSGVNAVGMEISLSGEVTSLISVAIGQARQGYPGRVWLGFFEPTNYTLDGSDLSAASWTREGLRAFGSGSVVNDAYAPDGTLTMDKLVEDTANGPHNFGQTYDLPINGIYQWQIYVKRNSVGSARDCMLQITQHGSDYILARFDLGTGQLISTTQNGNGKLFDQGIVSEGNGIYRIWLNGSPDLSSNSNGVGGYAYMMSGGFENYIGDNTSGLTVGGAQFTPVSDPCRLITDPYLAFEGRLDTSDITDAGESSRIALQYESRLIDLDRARERRYTSEDQQLSYPGDLGFDFVPTIQDMPLFWGRYG
jgi:hypothetical protein